MSVTIYLLFCSNCHFKKLTDGSDLVNLNEVKTCKTCGGFRQFKCPKCGFLLKATKAPANTKSSSVKAIEAIRLKNKEKSEMLQKEVKRDIKEDKNNQGDGKLL